MPVRLVHISDLHFDIAPRDKTTTHRHSIEHLKALSAKLPTQEYDRIVVSGDISNHGDSGSLQEARNYLLATITTDDGSACGISLGTTDKLIVIPGNHDAFNCTAGPSIWSKWQKSTKNFQAAFPERPLEKPYACGYDWVDDGDGAVFIAYLDSCYMGDPDPLIPYNPFRWARRAARGDVSMQQASELRRFYEDGIRGLLPLPDGSAVIPRERFASAAKVLVMHHYLFKPEGGRPDPFMRLRQRRQVLLNLALADFDLILCGHSHYTDVHRTTYTQNLDRRGLRRYMLAYAQRILGMEDYPRVLGPKTEQYALSNWASFVVNVFVKSAFISDPHSPIDDAEKAILSDLRNALGAGKEFRSLFRDRLEPLIDTGERVIRGTQLSRLHRRIVAALTNADRVQLAKLSSVVPSILRSLKQRPMVQLMSGSSAKALAPNSPVRAYSVYTFIRSTTGWAVEVDRYGWSTDKRDFDHLAEKKTTLKFEELRRPRRPDTSTAS